MGYFDDICSVAANGRIPFDTLKGSNILVTGATGLIGSCLVSVLMEHVPVDYHVYAMGRNEARADVLFQKYNNNSHFHFIKHDLLAPMTFDTEFHYIIHAASNASPVDFASTPVEVIKSNTMGLCNLMDYGKAHGLKRILFVSSGEVYGEGDGRDFDEKYSGYVDCTSLRSCYPTAKRAAESLCIAYLHEYGIESVIARLCHVYGPCFSERDNRAYAQFIRNAVKGQDIVLKSSGEQYRSWCYVVDSVNALLTILMKGVPGEAYNVADDTSNVTIRQMAETIASIAGRKVLFENPSDSERIGYNVVTKSVYNVDKLKGLGWESKHSLFEGLKHSIEWLI